MRPIRNAVRWSLWLVGGFLLLARTPAASTPAPLTVEIIVERMVTRAGEGLSETNGLHHTWRRLTTIEDLDSRGRVEERRTKEHSVVGRGEEQQASLVKINDQAPTDRDLSREHRKEGENQDRYARRRDRRGNLELDEQLIRRFRYQWLSNDLVEGRVAHVLAFSPEGRPDFDKVADRVLGHLGGRIWVDCEVYEVARIEAGLLKRLNIGGFIAELTRLEFLIERRPLPGGAWVNVKLDSHAAGRKLFHRFSGRMEVIQQDFQPLPSGVSSGAAGGVQISSSKFPVPKKSPEPNTH